MNKEGEGVDRVIAGWHPFVAVANLPPYLDWQTFLAPLAHIIRHYPRDISP
jgi:hypothetical protein